MNMDRFLHDLEAQFDALEGEERRGQAEDVARAERARITLRDRLRGAIGHDVRIDLASARGLCATGIIVEVGDGWFLVRERNEESLIPLSAVEAIDGLAARAREARTGAIGEVTFGSRLRQWARDRSQVRIWTVHHERRGVIAAVGADHVEVSSSPRDGQGRERESRVLMAFSSLLRVSRHHLS